MSIKQTSSVPPSIEIQEVLAISRSGNFADLLVKAPIRVDDIRDRNTGARTEPVWSLRDFIFRCVPVEEGVFNWDKWRTITAVGRTPEMARFARVWKGFEVEFPTTLPDES